MCFKNKKKNAYMTYEYSSIANSRISSKVKFICKLVCVRDMFMAWYPRSPPAPFAEALPSAQSSLGWSKSKLPLICHHDALLTCLCRSLYYGSCMIAFSVTSYDKVLCVRVFLPYVRSRLRYSSRGIIVFTTSGPPIISMLIRMP